MNQTVTSLDVTETAKVVRSVLRDHFPGITFSVRCDRYSMGASIDVRWEDGPTESQVTAVTDPYRRSDFDGRDDSTTVREPIIINGERMRFGADFISTHRLLSESFRALLADDIELAADPAHEGEELSRRVRWLSQSVEVTGENEVRRAS